MRRRKRVPPRSARLSWTTTLAEAHTSLARQMHRGAGDIDRAEAEFRRALELNPGYATAHQWYAILLSEEGRDGEALQQAERAVALDPLSAAIRQTLSMIHLFGRRYDKAVAEARRALDAEPELPLARQVLARSLVETGRPDEAIELLSNPPRPRPTSS